MGSIPTKEGDSLGNARVGENTPKKAVDVDDQCIFMVECANGAFGSIEATRNAWGRNNYITFEIHGTKGSIYFNYERRDELQVYLYFYYLLLFLLSFVHHPYGDGLWPIPALGIGYTETKIIEYYDFFRALQDGSEAAPNFRDGYAIELISDAILESAKTHQWVDVKSTEE